MKRFFDRDYILGFQFKIQQIDLPLIENDPNDEAYDRIDFEGDIQLSLLQFDYNFYEKEVYYGCVCKFEQLIEILDNSGETGKKVKEAIKERIKFINTEFSHDEVSEIKHDSFQTLYISNNYYERVLPNPEVYKIDNLILWMYIQNDSNDPSYREDDLRLEAIENTEDFVKFLQEYQPQDSFERRKINMYLQSIVK